MTIRPILSFALALACGLAAPLAQAETGLLLDVRVSRNGAEVMHPVLWGPVGTRHVVSDTHDNTLDLTSSLDVHQKLKLHVKLTEFGETTQQSAQVSVTAPLGQEQTLMLSDKKAFKWRVVYTARMADRPAR